MSRRKGSGPGRGRYKGNDEGGFGNPPVSGQFKKGGKPGPGRPPGSKSMGGVLKEVFGKKITYKINGDVVEQPAVRALAERLLAHGMSGPVNATLAAIKLAKEFGPQEPEEQVFGLPHMDEFTEEELDTFIRLLHKGMGKEYEPPVNDHPLAYIRDPDDRRNWHEEQTLDGLLYRRCDISTVDDQLIRMDNRAYWRAALPAKPTIGATTVVAR